MSQQFQHYRKLLELQEIILSVPSVHGLHDNISGKLDGALLPQMAATHRDASG